MGRETPSPRPTLEVVDGERLDFGIGLQAVEAEHPRKEVELAVQRVLDVLALPKAVLLALVDLEGRGHLLLEERLVLRGSDASRRWRTDPAPSPRSRVEGRTRARTIVSAWFGGTILSSSPCSNNIGQLSLSTL